MSLSEETLRLEFRNRIYLPLTAKIRQKKLKIKDFTIISNNCWGGTIYESYGLKKRSPTVGMFIMPDDYIEFVSNLKYYMRQELQFITPVQSKYREALNNKVNWGGYLLARLSNIELHMLHYHDESIARDKWYRRAKCINFDRIIYKFNDQNGCSIKSINDFLSLNLPNKLLFVAEPKFSRINGAVFIKQPRKYYGEGIKASREPIGEDNQFNVTSYLNGIMTNNADRF